MASAPTGIQIDNTLESTRPALVAICKYSNHFKLSYSAVIITLNDTLYPPHSSPKS